MAFRLASSVILALGAPALAARTFTSDLALMEGARSGKMHRWCVFHDGTLSCNEGAVISIQSAFYNRQETKDCMPAVKDLSIVCQPNATDALMEACDGRQRCALVAKDHATCPGNPYTFLRVLYKCSAGVAREDDAAPTSTAEPTAEGPGSDTTPADCEGGFWGPACDQRCGEDCPGACQRASGACQGCVPGMWGDFCDMPCPGGSGSTGCEQLSGVPYECDDDRIPGIDPKDGTPACLVASCPENCLDSKCLADGTCSMGCEAGFSGAKCESPCSPGCEGPCDTMATGLADGWCHFCTAGFTGDSCTEHCHPQCHTCEQRGVHAQGPDGCTACDSHEPETLQDGKCECIPMSTRSPIDGRCHCDEPDDPMKMAFFVADPAKQCRHICKKKFVEVFANKKSLCLTKAAYKAVIVSEGVLQQGDCEDGFLAVSVPGDDKPQCVHEDFVEHIVHH